MPNLPPNNTLSISEVSKYLKVSTKTLRRWEEQSLISSIRTTGGHRRYLASQIYSLRKDNKYSKVSKKNIFETFKPEGKQVILSKEIESKVNSPEDIKRLYGYEGPIVKTSFRQNLRTFFANFAFNKKAFIISGFISLVLFSSIIFALNRSALIQSLSTEPHPKASVNKNLYPTNQAQKVFDGLVLAESTSAEDITLKISVKSALMSDLSVGGNIDASGNLSVGGTDNDIAGTLNLSGNSLTSSEDLSIKPAGGDVTVGGRLILSDTYSLLVGGRTGTAYSSFANPADAPEETSISSDNDLYIGGDLEVDGSLFFSTLSLGGDSFTDLTGTGLQVSSGTLAATLGTSIDSSEITDDTIKEVDLSVSNSPTSGYSLTYNSGTSGFTWMDISSALTGGWTDGGTIIYLTAATDDVTIGSTADLAKLGVVGDANEIQLLVRGNSSQSANIFEIENSASSNLLTVDNSGNLTIASAADIMIGVIGLKDLGSDPTTSGASLIGVFDEFANSNSTNVQDVLDDLDSSIGAGSKWTDSGTVTYLTNTTDDLVVGDTTTTAAGEKISFQGNEDEIQFLVQGNAAQTSNLVVFEQSDGTDIFTVTNIGNVTQAGDLTVSGGNVTGPNAETIDIGEADNGSIIFTGVGETNNGSLTFDLETNSIPTLASSTDTAIGFDEDLTFIGTQTISTSDATDLTIGPNDVNFTATGGTSGNADVDIDGYLEVGGTAEFNGTIQADGTLDSNGEVTIADTDITFDGATTTFTTIGDLTFDSGTGNVFFADGDTLQIGGIAAQTYNAFAESGEAADNGAISADNDLYIGGDFEVDGTVVDMSAATVSVSDLSCTDCLDFTEFVNAMTVDEATTIASALATTSLDFNVSPAGTATAPIGFEITPTWGVDATDQTLIGLNINPDTNSNADTGDVLYGIQLVGITPTAGTENAINIGTGWDSILAGTTAGTNILAFTNVTITSAGNATLAGNLDVNGTANDIAGTLNLSGNNLTSSGDLSIDAGGGNVIFADNDTFQIGGTSALTYNALANDLETASDARISSDNDLFIGGDLEVAGDIIGLIACTDCIDWSDLLDAMTLDDPTIITHSSSSNTNSWTWNLINNGGAAGTDQLFVMSNAVSGNTSGDLNTEALLVLDQTDTTISGDTTLDNALLITNSGGSTLTNAITIGSGSQAISTALNIASTGVTTDISLQNGETIDNNTDGTIALGGDVSITGTTGLTFTGSGGQITFANGETIDNNTNNVINFSGTVDSAVIRTPVKSTTGEAGLDATEGNIYYNTTDNKFRCYQDTGWTDCIATATSPFTSTGGIIDKAIISDRLRLLYGDVADTQFEIDSSTNQIIPSADSIVIDLTSGVTNTGIVTDGVDALYIATEFGNGTGNTNSGIRINIDPVNSPSGDEIFYGLNIEGLSGTSAAETAINIDAGWDFDIDLQNGATVSNATNNEVALSENSRTLNLDFAEVASRIKLESTSELELQSVSDTPTAITIDATAGGIDITASGASAGEDIDISAIGSSLNLSASEAAPDAIKLTASDATGQIFVDAGTVDKTADAVVFDVDVDSSSVDALFIDLDVGTALSAAEQISGINVDVTGLGTDDPTSLLYGINLNGDITSTGIVKAINLSGSFDTGIDFDGTDVTTEIVLENGETISNQTNNQISLGLGTSGTLLLSSETTASLTNSVGALTIQSASSSNLNLLAGTSGQTQVVQIGAGGAGSVSPDFLGLDVKSDTGDPAGGAEGNIYYNNFTNRFRCFQDTSWVDCIGTGTTPAFDDIYQNSINATNLVMEIDDTGGLAFNMTTTGDFVFQDNGASLANFGDDSIISFTPSNATTAAGRVVIDGASTASAATDGLLDINATTNTDSFEALNLALSVSDDAEIDTITGGLISVDNDATTADDTVYALQIENSAASTANLDAGLFINNLNTALTISDAILIQSTGGGAITTGININDTDVVTDISLQNGESLSNNTDGTVTLAANSGALTLSLASDTAATISTTTGNLTLDSASNTIVLAASDTTLNASGLSTFTTASTLGMTSTTTLNCTDCINWDDLVDAMTLDSATTISRTNTGNESSLSLSLINNGGADGTDRLFVISNGVSSNASNDLTTEALLVLDQADTTVFGNTTVDSALLITKSGTSSLTNAISIGSSTETITTALNIASTGVTTDIRLQNAETIDNNTDGTVLIADGDTTTLLSASKTAFSINLDDTTTRTERLCHSGADAATGVVAISDCNSSPGDYAEYYGTQDSSLSAGDLVVVDPERPSIKTFKDGAQISKAWVLKSNMRYQASLIGIVSTNPNEVIADVFGPEENPRPIALNGRVPVKVSTENGEIRVGDPLTSSSIPGVAMKATAPGSIVGKALENYDTSDPNSIGLITIFVATSWSEPQFALDQLGSLQIAKDQNPGSENDKYKIVDKSGQIIDVSSVFTNIVVGNIKAGILESKEVATQALSALVLNVDNLFVRLGLESPFIRTEIISPVAQSNLVINLDNTQPGSTTSYAKLSIKGVDGTEVASIDAEGNTRIKGDATVSGELRANKIYADEIISKTASFADLRTANQSGVTREEIEKLLAGVKQDQVLLDQAANWPINLSEGTATLKEITSTNLYITNQAAVNSLSVSSTLTLANDFIIQSSLIDGAVVNSIDTISNPLKIQALALAPLEIMAGQFRIETNGDVVIGGDLLVKGRVESAELTLKESGQANDGASSGKLLSLVNFQGQEAAAISASGSAEFASVATNNLSINSEGSKSYYDLAGNFIIENNSTAGKGIIPAGKQEVIIRNTKTDESSLIYVTPLSNTNDRVLYIKSQTSCKGDVSGLCTPQFIVGFANALESNVDFNWWIVSSKQASSQ